MSWKLGVDHAAACYMDVATDLRSSAGRESGRRVGLARLTRRCWARAGSPNSPADEEQHPK